MRATHPAFQSTSTFQTESTSYTDNTFRPNNYESVDFVKGSYVHSINDKATENGITISATYFTEAQAKRKTIIKSNRRRRVVYVVVCLCLVFAVVSVAGIAIVSSADAEEDNEDSAPTESPTESPIPFTISASEFVGQSRFIAIGEPVNSLALAIDICQQLSPPALPASFTSNAEFESMIRLMDEVEAIGPELNFFWTGLRRLGGDGLDAASYTFLDGRENTFADRTGFFPWDPQEPNNNDNTFLGLAPFEDCATIERGQNVNTVCPNCVNDLPCDFEEFFVAAGVLCRQDL